MNAPKPGQHVFIIHNDSIDLKKVKEVCTGNGEPYSPHHGDDCYVSFDRRRPWVKHDRIYHDLADAQAALARKLRDHAEALVRKAEMLEARVAQNAEAKKKAYG